MRSTKTMIHLLSLTTILLCSWSVAGDHYVRVRKEIRTLSDAELNLFTIGIATMLSVPTERGQELFGPDYFEYDYFVTKHGVAANDPRGDQGHGATCFLSFHRAFVLEFEAALLSVVPELGALPYWDMLKDVRGGEYSDPSHPKYIFSSAYAGAITGNPDKQYTITDGLFAYHKISDYNWDKYGDSGAVFNGSLKTGLLRGPTNNNTNRYLTRYPYSNSPENNATYIDLILLPNPQPNEFAINFTEEDYLYCLDPQRIVNWMDWGRCADLTPLLATQQFSVVDSLLRKSRGYLLHTIPHSYIGGVTPEGDAGDFIDVRTSPNEVFLFMLHHGNVDRSNMIWQARAASLNVSKADRDVLWEFPRDARDYKVYDGCYRDDVVNSAFPFPNLFPGEEPSNPEGYTHGEVLWYTRPGASPYTYDNMYSTDRPCTGGQAKHHRTRRML